jgi:hypothetical protein
MKVAALLVVAPVRKVASDQVASDAVPTRREDISMLQKETPSSHATFVNDWLSLHLQPQNLLCEEEQGKGARESYLSMHALYV